jgi:hypothetical protein
MEAKNRGWRGEFAGQWCAYRGGFRGGAWVGDGGRRAAVGDGAAGGFRLVMMRVSRG